MKRSITQFLMWLTLFGWGTVLQMRADTENAADYFVITQSFGGLDRPWLEFEYADYDAHGQSDALDSPKFGVVVEGGKRYEVAYMSRCHDNMKFKNTDFGLFEVLSTYTGVHANEDLRIVKMRYYPSERAMKEVIAIYHTGRWFIDDNPKNSSNYDINKVLHAKFTDNTVNLKTEASLDFDGKTYLVSYRTNNTLNNSFYASWYSPEVVVNNSSSGWDSGDLIGTYSYDKMAINGLSVYQLPYSISFNPDLKLYAWTRMKVHRQVRNGSYGHEDELNWLNQAFNVSEPCELRTKPLTNRILSAKVVRNKRAQNTLLFDMAVQGAKIDVDVYRKNRVNGYWDYLQQLEYDGGAPNMQWTDPSSDPFTDAEYAVSVHEQRWIYSSFQEQLGKQAQIKGFKFHGSGTEKDPYQLWNAPEMKMMSFYVNLGKPVRDVYWKLKDDVTLSYPDGSWEGIGSEKHPFGGFFDGNGKQIRLYLNHSQTRQNSLFGQIRDANIKDVRIDGDIITSDKYTGGIAGCSVGAQIENCEVGVRIHSSLLGEGAHGGIIGKVSDGDGRYKYTYLKDCVFNGSIDGNMTDRCGGIVGESSGPEQSCQLRGCMNMGSFAVSPFGSDVMVRGAALVDSCYYLNAFGTNAHGALPLGETEKGLGLLDILGTEHYQFTAARYPCLKLFSPFGKDYDILMSQNYPPANHWPQEGVKVRFDRSFEAGHYYTLVLPYALSAREAAEWGTFYSFTSFEPAEGIVLLTEEENGTEANQPYLFKAASTFDSRTTEEVTFEATADVFNASEAPELPGLSGTYCDRYVPYGAFRFLHEWEMGQRPERFVRVFSDYTQRPFTAFLWLGYEAGNRERLTVHFANASGDVTGIGTLLRDENRKGIYTLDGRKVSTPQRGINIIDGRKVYVK